MDEAFIPGLRQPIIGRPVQSPLDHERAMPTAVHGTHMHGAFVPYQSGAFRADAGDARLPGRRIAGVYLCGAGAHPGSGVTMGPGRNAAMAICRDRGLTFPGRVYGTR